MIPMCNVLKKWCFLLSLPIALFADKAVVPVAPQLEWEAPWFTGPLLASSPTVVPLGHFAFEGYVTYLNNPARYDNDWKVVDVETFQQVVFQPFFWIGIAPWADLQLVPQWSWNYREGPAHWDLNDFTAKLEFQLYRDQIPNKNWLPSLKLGIQETFPTGKYRNLNPKKLFTDQGGMGAWTTTFQFSMGKIFHIHKEQWLQARLNFNYALSAPVHVTGLNAYGGGVGTNGTVRPGGDFYFDYAFEYSLTRNWALACDFVGDFRGCDHFSGKPGFNEDGSTVIVERQASIQWSMAPAIEYNWNESLGIIAGSWFTLAGKNSNKFYTCTIALNYYK